MCRMEGNPMRMKLQNILAHAMCGLAIVLLCALRSSAEDRQFGPSSRRTGLTISEIMYHPAEDPNAEYLELTNVGAETINLNLVQLTNGVDFTFPSVELDPGAYLLVVRDVAAFEARYGSGLPIAGQYVGSLNNTGERIELEDAAGRTIHNFRFQDGWYDVTDGLDFSLTVKDPPRFNIPPPPKPPKL